MTDQELRELVASNSRAIADLTAVVLADHQTTIGNTQAIAELGQNVQAIGRDIAQLVATQQETARQQQEAQERADQEIAELRAAQGQTQANLDRLSNITERFIDISSRNFAELRAGQEQQARVLDYLLQKEQERQNGTGGS